MPEHSPTELDNCSGQETWSMIKGDQVGDTSMLTWERFYALTA